MSFGISIITPVFNRLDLLKKTAASVLNQSSAEWEWILVDDGSDSEVVDYLRYLEQGDSRIFYYHRGKEKKGAPVCRNLGASKARYDLLWFLDSDDLLGSDSIKLRLETVRNNPVHDFWVFPVGLFNSEPHDILQFQNVKDHRNDLDRFCFGENVWQTLGVVWKKIFFNSIGGFNEDLPSFQDWELSIRSLIGSEKYWYEKLVIPDAFYRITEGESISNKRYNEKNAIANAEMILDTFKLMKEHRKINEARRISLLNFFISRLKYWEFIETRQDRIVMKRIYFHKAINVELIKTEGEKKLVDRYLFYKPGIIMRIFSLGRNFRTSMEDSKIGFQYFKRGQIGLTERYQLPG